MSLDIYLKALQLADALELDPMPLGWYKDAAAELRRLHAENEQLREAAWMALNALFYHREQTRPIHSTDEAIDALRDALGEEK